MRALQSFATASLLALAAPAAASTFTVINTNDSGPGSLRECVQVVNMNPPGPHRIAFAIPGTGVQTIHLFSTLDAITSTVAIDGTTQPGYNFAPLIEVDGTGSSIAMVLSAPHSSVKGLVLNHFPNSTLNVFADACTVSACYIGTNASGTAKIGNGLFGVFVSGNDVLIGGRQPASRNIISGNGFGGVSLTNTCARDTIIGNYIGTDVTGTFAIPNEGWGVETGGAYAPVIDGNLISGNNGDGIYVDGNTPPPADGVVRIYRNLIGTDASGMNKLPNQQNGISILLSYTNVGSLGLGNVISGNNLYGIYVNGNFSSGSQILGNKIGVSSDGTKPLGNTLSGIRVANSSGNYIGGNKYDGSGNLIGANGNYGVEIDGLNGTDNLIFGNAIGTSFNGALNLGNAVCGIAAFSDRATIGGTGVLGNIIAHNASGGIRIASVQNSIRANSIFENPFGLGIDLFDPGTGVTPNDSLDGDDGANHLQNFPVLTSVTIEGSLIHLQGRLQSVPGHTFTLDF